VNTATAHLSALGLITQIVNTAAAHLAALGLITQIPPHYKYKLIPRTWSFLELINESRERHIVLRMH